jgi:hypothetical protein
VRLAYHGLLDALNLARGRHLGLQLRLTGWGGLCVRVCCLP